MALKGDSATEAKAIETTLGRRLPHLYVMLPLITYLVVRRVIVVEFAMITFLFVCLISIHSQLLLLFYLLL